MDSTDSPRNWEALGTEVRRRRGLLHLRQSDMEARGGPSAGTMRNIEQASRTSYAPRTFVQLETALQFGDGVVEKILDGTATRSEIDEVVPRGTVTGENWQALAAAVKARRELLRLPQQLIGHDGPGEMTMRKIERAETTAIRDKTKTQLERALRMRTGLVDRILDGTATRSEIDEVVPRGTADENWQDAERLVTMAGLLAHVDKAESFIVDAIDRGEVDPLAGSRMILRFASFRARLLGY